MKKLPLLLSFFLIACVVKAQLPTNVPLNGLVAFYPFSGNANDAGVNALHGTVAGPVLTSDRLLNANSAYYFSFGYISVPTNSLFNTGNEMTVAAWVNLTSSSTNQKIIGRTNSSFNSGFILGVQNGQVYPEVWDDLGSYYTSNSGALSTGGWDHLCMTWKSGGYMVIYVNGIAVDSLAANGPIGTNSEPLIIGVSPWSQSPSYFEFSGGLDDIGIWSRALIASEVLALYQSIPQGIDKLTNQSQASVFPNPAGNRMTIRTSKKHSGPAFRLTDALGRKLMHGELNAEFTTIDIEILPAGIYFLEVDEPIKSSFKVVKM